MMTNVFHALGTALVAGAPLGNAIGTLLPAALLVSAVVIVVGGLRLRASSADHTTQTQQLQQQNDLLRGVQDQLQKLRADLDEKQREVQSLRQESGTQRKKNHATQEEIKRLRTSLKEETERRIAAQNTRPAFAEPTTPKVVAPQPRREAPKPQIEAQPKVAAAAAPAVATPGPSELALQAQVKTLEAELARQRQAMGDERVLMSGLKDELKKLRRRSEDLRRIDIITKSKMEILEDKMRHLGRAHYEAISEVALLKGEVRPPKFKEPSRQISMFESPDVAEQAAAAAQRRESDEAAAMAQVAELAEVGAEARGSAVMQAAEPAQTPAATEAKEWPEDSAVAQAAELAQVGAFVEANDQADALTPAQLSGQAPEPAGAKATKTSDEGENDSDFASTGRHDAPSVAQQASLL